jgi:hypothetical protein
MSTSDVQTWIFLATVVFIGVMLAIRGFRGGRHRPPPRILPAPDDSEPASRSQPRPQHYQFAHRILRDIVLDRPQAAFDMLTMPNCAEHLVNLWVAARSDDPKEPPIPPDGIRVYVEEDIAVVALPPPARVPEAYMIGVTRSGAYYTLEKGIEGPFVGQWTKTSHTHFSSVRFATREKFLELVREIMKPLVCCPYCISPVPGEGVVCAKCGRDTKNDALVEYERQAYLGAPRRPCGACGKDVIDIAVTCPHCREKP